MAQLRIPTVLRPAVGGQSSLEIEASTIGELLGELTTRYPNVGPQVLGADGALHRFLNVYVNDDDVRYIGGLNAALSAGDVVTLLPAVAGGSL